MTVAYFFGANRYVVNWINKLIYAISFSKLNGKCNCYFKIITVIGVLPARCHKLMKRPRVDWCVRWLCATECTTCRGSTYEAKPCGGISDRHCIRKYCLTTDVIPRSPSIVAQNSINDLMRALDSSVCDGEVETSLGTMCCIRLNRSRHRSCMTPRYSNVSLNDINWLNDMHSLCYG